MSKKNLQKIGLFSLLSYFFLNVILSALSINLCFIIFGFVHVIVVVISGIFIEKDKRFPFMSITYLFFLVYSLFAVVSYFIIYENPLVDHLGDGDQIGYYKKALYLSSLSFSEIWITVFTEYQYHEAPLFNAWIATIHKISRLDTYFGALNQKLNLVFFSSFIPSLLYLMSEKILVDKRLAIKWSILFGFFSFFFYYSGILLRDIHLSLVYTMAFYLLLKEEYSIKVFLFLIMLGVISYFLRIESGLFFLGFFGLWFIHSNSRRNLGIGLFTVPVIAFIVVYIGGIDYIVGKGLYTLQSYAERRVQNSSDDSLGLALSRLPIPLNWVGRFTFSQIAPFPFWRIFEDEWLKNFFYLPRIVGTLFWTFVWTHIVTNFQKFKPIIKKYKWHIILAFVYIFFVSQGQPYERRLIQVYPFLFLIFMFFPQYRIKNSAIYFVLLYLGLIGIYYSLKL